MSACPQCHAGLVVLKIIPGRSGRGGCEYWTMRCTGCGGIHLDIVNRVSAARRFRRPDCIPLSRNLGRGVTVLRIVIALLFCLRRIFCLKRNRGGSAPAVLTPATSGEWRRQPPLALL